MGQSEAAGAGGQEVREGERRLDPLGDEPDLRNALGLQLPQTPGGATEGGGVCLDGHGEYAVLLLRLVGDTLALRVADPVGRRLALRHRLGGVFGELGALGRPGVRLIAALALGGFRAVGFGGGIVVVDIGLKQMIQRRDGFRSGVGWWYRWQEWSPHQRSRNDRPLFR